MNDDLHGIARMLWVRESDEPISGTISFPLTGTGHRVEVEFSKDSMTTMVFGVATQKLLRSQNFPLHNNETFVQFFREVHDFTMGNNLK